MCLLEKRLLILLLIVINGSVLALLRQRVTAPFRHYDRLTLFDSTEITVDLNRTIMHLCLRVWEKERRTRVCKQGKCGVFMTLCVALWQCVCQGADLDITVLFQHDDKTTLSTVSHIAQSVKLLCVWKIGRCVLVCVLVGKAERDRRLWKARVCVCVWLALDLLVILDLSNEWNCFRVDFTIKKKKFYIMFWTFFNQKPVTGHG